jgi:hypothetical protein
MADRERGGKSIDCTDWYMSSCETTGVVVVAGSGIMSHDWV